MMEEIYAVVMEEADVVLVEKADVMMVGRGRYGDGNGGCRYGGRVVEGVVV